jgi:FkbM family methyltransferase
MRYYSQFGQDQYLYENFFRDMKDGVFVDIGAHDGMTGSNTKFFEDLGWQGICFEPIPEVFDQLYKNRRCIVSPIAIYDRQSTVQFRRVKGYSEMLSGIIETQSSDQVTRIDREVKEHDQIVELIVVDTLPFYPTVPFQHIDVLSLDVEGAEDRIIRNIPFELYDIKFMIIEFNNFNSSLDNYITSKGYECVAQKGVDRIYKKI